MENVVRKESEVRQSYWNNYWEKNSSNHTIEGMMFDTKAVELDKEDRPEVCFFISTFFFFVFLLKIILII